jgi:hypothetical protein
MDPLKSGINLISVEDMVTFKGKDELLICEFCDRPIRYEVEIEVAGHRKVVWLCGQCNPSREIISSIPGGGE